MNRTTTDQLPPAAAAQLPLQPPRSSFSCDRHPTENFSGFCPECLCERLTTLDPSTTITSSSASFKSIFRRTKSLSASKNEGLLGFSVINGFEPQRKSCDVRNTLSSLFETETLSNNIPVLQPNREEEIIKVNEWNVNTSISNIVDEITEIEKELDEDLINDELKIMKEHVYVDLDSESKNKSKSSGLWSAASVLSQKWRKWRRKQKKTNEDVLPVEKRIKSKYRETQSEIADYGFGRRSCDVDPRFSLDVGRMSIDDPRYSFDEPRASWDGYMIGRAFPRLPPMVEDVPVVPVPVSVPAPVPRLDMLVSVQLEQEVIGNDDFVPGGSVQTLEYYTDSSSKRRKSLDRPHSIRKMAAAVVAEMDDAKTSMNVGSNAKVSPARIDCSYGGLRSLSIGGERELGRDSNSNSLRDDCSETFELRLRDNNVGDKKESKKPRRWRWKLWGFIHRRGGNKDNEEEHGFSSVYGVKRSYLGSWEQSGINKKVFRSNSSISWRNSSYNMKKSTSEINRFGNGKNRRVGGDELVLERHRSARYSPNHTDSRLLRFYLTPLRGSQRSRPTSNLNNSIPRNVLRV